MFNNNLKNKTMKTVTNFLIIAAIGFFSSIASAQEKGNAEVKIKTSAQCESCQNRIESKLNFTKGVKSAKLDIKTQIVTIVYNPEKTSPEKLREVISKTGYDADEVPADQKAYGKLPKCCKKPQ